MERPGLLPISALNDQDEEISSPYRMTLVEFANRFGGSAARLALLESLHRHRALLRSIGLTSWFQWIDGSFVENALSTRVREPEDIDIVTFYNLPPGQEADEFQPRYPEIFDWEIVKEKTSLDCYFVPLNGDSIEDVITAFRYWQDWWSHTREGDEKGFIRLESTLTEDEALESWSLERSSGGLDDEHS